MSSTAKETADALAEAKPEKLTSGRSLAVGIAAAIGASLCCVAPFVLLLAGIGGAWISTLTALTPYRPIFIGITLVFVALAFRKLYLVPRNCAEGTVCSVPSTLRRQRIIFWVVSGLLAVLIAFPWYGPLMLA